jgi:hypothetical protein
VNKKKIRGVNKIYEEEKKLKNKAIVFVYYKLKLFLNPNKIDPRNLK